MEYNILTIYSEVMATVKSLYTNKLYKILSMNYGQCYELCCMNIRFEFIELFYACFIVAEF
jgi:hypothetical protein